MPTVLRQNGFEIIIYTADHTPIHVDVKKAGAVLVVNVGAEDEAPSIRENKEMKRNEVSRALKLVAANQAYLIQQWREIHG